MDRNQPSVGAAVAAQIDSFTRFSTPTDALSLEELLRRQRKLLYWAIIAALVVLAVPVTYLVTREEEQKAPKPPTMHLVVRKPRLTKAFEFEKRKIFIPSYSPRKTDLRTFIFFPEISRLGAGPPTQKTTFFQKKKRFLRRRYDKKNFFCKNPDRLVKPLIFTYYMSFSVIYFEF